MRLRISLADEVYHLAKGRGEVEVVGPTLLFHVPERFSLVSDVMHKVWGGSLFHFSL